MNRKVFAVSTIALLLMVFAVVLTTRPAEAEARIAMTASIWSGPKTIGIGQKELIYGCVYPPPPYRINHTYTITMPNRTRKTIVILADAYSQSELEITCDAVGTWLVTLSFAGDAKYSPASTSTSWTVVTEPQPPLSKIKTYAYISALYPKVGTGEYNYIVGWVSPPPVYSGPIYYNFKFTVTKPDNSRITVTKNTDSAATASFSVKCDQSGTWKAKFEWTGEPFQKIMEGCVSPEITWEVEDGYVAPKIEPIPPPEPDTPLKFPVSSECYDWANLIGPWWNSRCDKATNFNPYTRGPETAHILWAKPLSLASFAGLIGGEWGAYEHTGLTAYTVAADGKLLFANRERDETNRTRAVVYCMDIFTGELIYRSVLPGESPGSLRVALEILPRLKIDPKLGYAPSAYSLWVMDMTRGIWEVDPRTGGATYYNWTLPGGAYWKGAIYIGGYPTTGVLSKFDTRLKSIEWSKPCTWNDRVFETQWISNEGYLVVRGSRVNGYPPYNNILVWNATTGDLVANFTGFYDPDAYVTHGGWGDTLYDGKIFVGPTIGGWFFAVDLKTGTLAAKTDPIVKMPWGAFGLYTASAGYGMVFMGAWDGYLYAFDAKTLELKWKFYCGDNPDTAMGHNVPWGVAIVGGGKVYVTTGEHTMPNPVPRGNKLYCIDAYTGNQLWNISFGYQTRTSCGIHAGVLWYQNRYDGQVYAFGKGPSAVTVSASSTVVPVGSRVLIQGTITDESAGAKGTPAIADEYMTEWMEYLYMQKPMPTNAKGVPILIQAALPNGTVIEIGWTTSDIMGHYEIEWTPPEPGTYKILATFLGTKSYYPSAAQTAITVTEKAAPAGIEGISTWEAITLTLTIITLIIVVYLAVKTKKQ